MKKCAYIRSNNLTGKKCPFGLPITEACENAGNSVTHMCPLAMVEEEKQEPIKLANSRVYVYYKNNQPCIYAANIMKNQNVVNCNLGDSAAGMHAPQMEGSPLYAQTFAGCGLDGLYALPLGLYSDNNQSRNLFEGLFSLIGELEQTIVKEALSKNILEKLENKEVLSTEERLELEGFLEDCKYYFNHNVNNNENVIEMLRKLRRI